jgi:diguanylate cyclase (GGDEF)-like protein
LLVHGLQPRSRMSKGRGIIARLLHLDDSGASRRAQAFSALGIVAVAALDHATGFELRVYPLYFLPLCLGAWHGRPVVVGALVMACTAAWAVSNRLAGLHYASWYAWPFNTAMQALAFGVVAGLVRRIRVLLERERMLSRVDPLTQLANRRAFQERGALELARAARTGAPITIACLDLDNLKVLNDWAGHLQGDAALMTLADVLRHTLRQTDLMARLGGDEFAVILPETDQDQARGALERVRSAFSAAAARMPADVSVSIGGLTLTSPPALEAAMSMADAVLYRVKRTGKDGVRVSLDRPPHDS